MMKFFKSSMTLSKTQEKNYLFLSTLIILSFLLLVNCSKDKNDPASSVNLEEALLNDFPLSEVGYDDIKITQPKLTNGIEAEQGKIEIIIPYQVSYSTFSLKSVNFDVDKFGIFPGIGVKTLFSSTEPVIFEIAALKNRSKIVHYAVTIEMKPPPQDETLAITGFKFEKSKNPGLPSDVEAIKIVDNPNTTTKSIIVIVPLGTDFTKLVPTISYTGASVEYRQNNDDYIAYPAEGTELNFKYPNFLQIKLNNTSGSRTKLFRLYADVPNPIKFDKAEINIPDINLGEKYSGGLGIITWQNQGNIPMTGVAATSYTVLTNPAAGGSKNIFRAALTKTGAGNINPGEIGKVDVFISNTNTEIGKYKSTAYFAITLNHDNGRISYWPPDSLFVVDIYEPAKIDIDVTIK